MSKKMPTDPAQIDGFRNAARELGCDESEGLFDTKLVAVARASVPRKPAAPAKGAKPQRTSKAAPKPTEPGKKKIRFNLSGA